MSNKGWIKLHRKIMDNEIWDSPEPFDKRSAWIHLLMMANHEARTINIGNELIDLQPGQFFTSIRKLATIFGWNFKRVMRYFDLLKGAGMIRSEGTAKGTLVTIVNYEVYQLGGNTRGNTKGNDNRDARGNANGTQTRSYKNDKESIRTRARGRASKIKPQERDYDMDALELKLRATNNSV